MIMTLEPGARTGKVTPPVSKSIAHRKMICAALAGGDAGVDFDPNEKLSADILATEACLKALLSKGDGYRELPCGESGSTLRFLLPVAAALGTPVKFLMEGLLPHRPHKELIEQLTLHGATVRQEGNLLYCEGKLTAGTYTIPGGVSSQFISGLLFALPLLDCQSRIRIDGKLESAAYVLLTEQAIAEAGIRFTKEPAGYTVPGGQKYLVSGTKRVEADWSGAAFFVCMGALGQRGITVSGLNPDSVQGDRNILTVVRDFGAEVEKGADGILVKRGKILRPLTVDASEIPDLVPVISVLAAGVNGTTRITHAERLRFKESDRLKTTAALIKALGGDATETADGLIINGTGELRGGTVDAAGDHRIAMSAAVAAAICREPVVIPGAECVAKSYPAFFEDFNRLEADG